MDNKALATTIGLLAGSIVVVKLTFAVLGAVNDIPFLGNIFELVGMVYTLKLIATNLKADNRQQSISELQETLEQVGLVEVTNVIKSAVESTFIKKEEVITGWDVAETSQEVLQERAEKWLEETDKINNSLLGEAFTNPSTMFYVINPEGNCEGKPFTTEQEAWDTIPEEHLHEYDVVPG
jgi:hypothetical protein